MEVRKMLVLGSKYYLRGGDKSEQSVVVVEDEGVGKGYGDRSVDHFRRESIRGGT